MIEILKDKTLKLITFRDSIQNLQGQHYLVYEYFKEWERLKFIGIIYGQPKLEIEKVDHGEFIGYTTLPIKRETHRPNKPFGIERVKYRKGKETKLRVFNLDVKWFKNEVEKNLGWPYCNPWK